MKLAHINLTSQL